MHSQVLRKVKKEVDRLPSQGRDPADSFQHGWRHASAIMLERYPVIIPEQHEFEHEYLKGRFLAQQQESIPIPMELFLTERDIVEGRKEPNFRDPVAEQYTPAPRRTDADARNDTKSLNRALDERLYLVVKTGGGSGSGGGRDQRKPSAKTVGKFRFPQMLADDENVPLWEYASRALHAITKPDLVVSSSPTSSVTMKNNQDKVMIHFISARPCCHLEHVYPLAYQKRHDVYGVKIFFYKAVLLQGKLESHSQLRSNVVSDFHWARETELEHLLGSDYYEWIEPALVGVGPSNDFKV